MITKHKEPNHSATNKLKLLDEIQEHAYFQWLIDNRRFLPYGFLALVIIIGLAFKFTSGKTVAAESNYLLAENYFSQIHDTLQVKTESINSDLKKLMEITEAYPELQSRYDGPIAQILILLKKPQEAQNFATRALQRSSKEQNQDFVTFSEITLHIANGALKEALEKSKSLKAKMLNDSKTNINAHLFAFNLLRIAMLEEKSGTVKGEMEGWMNWKQFASGTDNVNIKQAIATINDLLKEGEFSLGQYINIRENAFAAEKK